MSKRTIHLIIALLAFLLGVAVTTTWYFKQPHTAPKLHLIILNASWEPSSFKLINSVVKLSAQTDLRKTNLPESDIEVRMWLGFGLSPLKGVTLKRVSGQWSAIRVKADNYYKPEKIEREELGYPKSGWDVCWKRLVEADILMLPDISEVNCGDGALDGASIVIETNTNRIYRTYAYGVSMLEKCHETKQAMKVIFIIDEEFGWED